MLDSESNPLTAPRGKTGALAWKIGFEIELLAPAGSSRRALAERVARERGGSVRTFFHPQSEPSHVPGQPVFENLTAGFSVLDADGTPFASFVDDLTLQADLRPGTAPLPGWYRIVADDGRLLRLIMRHCDPDAPHDRVLVPVAGLFGTQTEQHDGGMVRVADARGVSVAICAPLPGERERTCEIVTAPIERDHDGVITGLLAQARAMGFIVPREGATHLHFDGAALHAAPVIARLVRVFGAHREALRKLVGVNPHCIRLGDWPRALTELALSDGFAGLDWPEACEALADAKPSKYCDFNLLNLITGDAAKDTFEVRILPGALDPAPILAAAALFEALLLYCVATRGERDVPAFQALLARLDLPPAALSILAGIRAMPGDVQVPARPFHTIANDDPIGV